MRQLFAAVGALAASAFGALILGEYPMVGATPFVAGTLFGLVVAELVLTVAKPRPAPVTAAAAVAGPTGGMVWAMWISAGRDWHYAPHAAWIGVALAAAASAFWLRSGRRKKPAEPA
jgi:hypothetical protein